MPIRRSMKWPSHNPLRGLDAAQRRDIVDAVRHGRAVRDPRNAPLAAAWAQEMLGFNDRQRRPRAWLIVHMIVIAAAAWLLREPSLLTVGVVPLLLVVILAAASRRSVEQLERAAEANRELALSFGLEVPTLNLGAHSFVPAIRSRRGAFAIAATVGVMVAVVAVAIVRRDTAAQTGSSAWAKRSNAICAEAAGRYRQAKVERKNGTLLGELPLSELTRIRRAAVQTEHGLVLQLRALGPPRGAPTEALDALARKNQIEQEALRAAERGDQASFDRVMQKMIPSAWGAKRAFEQAGASTCSMLL
jgi:hypothetical protein